MDLVSGQVRLDLNTATIAVNRYAAGWIDPDNVVVHEPATTEVTNYDHRDSVACRCWSCLARHRAFSTRSERVSESAGISLSRNKVLRSTGTTSVHQRAITHHVVPAGVSRGVLNRTHLLSRAPGTGTTCTVGGRPDSPSTCTSVGDSFEVGRVTVEIVERIGNYYRVRIVDPSTPDPTAASGNAFAGRFSDDDGSVHEANIEVIAELGITRGCGDPEDNTFCPKRLVARSHIVTFLARALGEEEGEGSTTSRFSDVPDDAWYLASLERLADLGVVEPFDGTFRPREPITRMDMAVFMTRAFPHIDKVEPGRGLRRRPCRQRSRRGSRRNLRRRRNYRLPARPSPVLPRSTGTPRPDGLFPRPGPQTTRQRILSLPRRTALERLTAHQCRPYHECANVGERTVLDRILRPQTF